MQTYLVTPAFAKAKLVECQLDYVHSTNNLSNITHVVIDNHYPVDKQENRARIAMACAKYGAIYLDSGRDLGLHEGLNNAVKTIGIRSDDILIGLDPDDFVTPGSIQVLEKVMKATDEFAVLGLGFSVIYDRLKEGVPFERRTIAGESVLIHPTIEMWNVCAWNMKTVYSMGGFKQPNKYYGGIEVATENQMLKDFKRLGYLEHWKSDHLPVDRNDTTLFDPQYRNWKTAHAHKGYQGSFEEFLTL